MRIEMGRDDISGILIWSCWLVVLAVCLSLVTGSAGEYEPLAAQRFGILAALWAATGPLLWVWRKRRNVRR
ncbi:hypothetical protein GGQ74_001983 [Desulfobaculum xiamenense]|uniref:Uncharacterized protein n=1 Tax=Desulfobaculum xiamenense TaxID=995050 RepID=A0A846QMR1_9BACT|nr:hypothetical protein [Desulfobaculum xiamenense]NJB68310.1 hypothetical protein [Desulfobaculum xiamenense]